MSGPVTLRFVDGSGAAGTLSGEVLHTTPYTTASGNKIAAKSWQIAFDGDRFRITARAAP